MYYILPSIPSYVCIYILLNTWHLAKYCVQPSQHQLVTCYIP